MNHSPTPRQEQTPGNHQATSTLAKPTLSSQGSIFTPHPTPPPSSQPVRNLVDPAWTLPFNPASDGLPALLRPRRARPVGVHNTPRLQICTVVILWFDVIRPALRGGRWGGRVDMSRRSRNSPRTDAPRADKTRQNHGNVGSTVRHEPTECLPK